MSQFKKPNQHLGVTAPLSLAYPEESELKESEILYETLKKNNLFESEEEAKKREIILGRISILVKEFVRKVYLKKNMPPTVAEEAGGKIFTYGSYRLGVHSSGDDIDTLCVVPKHVKREDFFEVFLEMLKGISEIKELTPVQEAYVPIIKMEYSGIPIDLIFASIDVNKVSDDLELKDNNLLKGLDEATVRSLNGSRVTDDILRLVPNIPEFRISLRCIKLWAKRRGMYGNVYGFFGGVAWAMLVARVCQLYPNATSACIINKFFNLLSIWKWPYPIILREIESCNIPLRVWNPSVYPSDRAHRMPIITPAFPSMCSTHNVSASTQALITQELKRGAEITKKIFGKQATWDELFKEQTFFFNYSYYLKITAYSDDEELQLKWSGAVESKIRQLIMALEQVYELVLVHPYNKEFNKVYIFSNDQAKEDAIKKRFIDVKSSSEEELAEAEESKKVYTTSFYLGLSIKPRPDDAVGKRKLVIWKQVTDFLTRMATFNTSPEHSAITIGTIKNENLPDEVFTQDQMTLRKYKLDLKIERAKRKREDKDPNDLFNEPELVLKQYKSDLEKDSTIQSTSNEDELPNKSTQINSNDNLDDKEDDDEPSTKKNKTNDGLVLEAENLNQVDLEELAKKPAFKLSLKDD